MTKYTEAFEEKADSLATNVVDNLTAVMEAKAAKDPDKVQSVTDILTEFLYMTHAVASEYLPESADLFDTISVLNKIAVQAEIEKHTQTISDDDTEVGTEEEASE